VREKVLPKIDEVVPDDVRQNERGSHVDTDRLQQDHEQREECPVGMGFRGLILTRAKVKLYSPTLIWAVIALFVPIQAWWADFTMKVATLPAQQYCRVLCVLYRRVNSAGTREIRASSSSRL
jgi:hypothetical protein